MGQLKDLSSGQVSQTYTFDYCGNVIYENGSLSKILTEEGYVTFSGGTPTYHYYLKDHQGNNRMVVRPNCASWITEQENHYYPFGGVFEVNTTNSGIQAYKYNGKELDRMHGLDWYDYGARHYDAALGRFTRMDRFAEKYFSMSLYQYGANNPINAIDINGDSIWFTPHFKKGHFSKITMHITDKVINDSKESLDMNSIVSNISKAIKRAYQGKVDGVSFETDIQLSIVQKMDNVSDSDHLFVLTDKISKIKQGRIYEASNYIGGKVAFIDVELFSGYYDEVLGSRNYGSYTAAHEFGHLAGLNHSSNYFNIMRSNGMF